MERETETETDRQIDRLTERQRKRQRDRQTDRDRETEREREECVQACHSDRSEPRRSLDQVAAITRDLSCFPSHHRNSVYNPLFPVQRHVSLFSQTLQHKREAAQELGCFS